MKFLIPLAALVAFASAAPVSQEASEGTVERRILNGLPLVGDLLPGGSPGKRDEVTEGTVERRILNGLPLVGDLLPGGSPGKRDQVAEWQLESLPVAGPILSKISLKREEGDDEVTEDPLR